LHKKCVWRPGSVPGPAGRAIALPQTPQPLLEEWGRDRKGRAKRLGIGREGKGTIGRDRRGRKVRDGGGRTGWGWRNGKGEEEVGRNFPP